MYRLSNLNVVTIQYLKLYINKKHLENQVLLWKILLNVTIPAWCGIRSLRRHLPQFFQEVFQRLPAVQG